MRLPRLTRYTSTYDVNFSHLPKPWNRMAMHGPARSCPSRPGPSLPGPAQARPLKRACRTNTSEWPRLILSPDPKKYQFYVRCKLFEHCSVFCNKTIRNMLIFINTIRFFCTVGFDSILKKKNVMMYFLNTQRTRAPSRTIQSLLD